MKIIVLAALDAEICGLREAMSDVNSEKKGAFDTWRGSIGGHELILCRCGVGKTNSAAAASALLALEPDADFVFNTGVAGGIGGGVKRGDVVLGSRTVHHDYDQTADGLRKGQIEGFDSEFFDGDARLIEAMEQALESEKINYRVGVIASGDRFVADKETAQAINAQFGAFACEMESASIAQVCALYKVPYLAVRAISDDGGDGAVGSFYEFLRAAAANNVRAILRFISRIK